MLDLDQLDPLLSFHFLKLEQLLYDLTPHYFTTFTILILSLGSIMLNGRFTCLNLLLRKHQLCLYQDTLN